VYKVTYKDLFFLPFFSGTALKSTSEDVLWNAFR